MSYENYSVLEKRRRIRRAIEVVAMYQRFIDENVFTTHKEAYHKLRQMLLDRCPCRATLYSWIKKYGRQE